MQAAYTHTRIHACTPLPPPPPPPHTHKHKVVNTCVLTEIFTGHHLFQFFLFLLLSFWLLLPVVGFLLRSHTHVSTPVGLTVEPLFKYQPPWRFTECHFTQSDRLILSFLFFSLSVCLSVSLSVCLSVSLLLLWKFLECHPWPKVMSFPFLLLFLYLLF